MKPTHLCSALFFLVLPTLGYAAPASTTTTTTTTKRGKQDNRARDVKITAAQIETIAPKSKSCADAPAPGECATSEQAAANIAKSFEKYKVTSAAEQAAVIGLMAFESLDFEYNRNHFPGVPGQGTRNMQSPAFNAKYAASLTALADKLKGVSGDPAGVLDLLLSNEEYDFGSGAWFLTTQCSQDVRSELQSGSEMDAGRAGAGGLEFFAAGWIATKGSKLRINAVYSLGFICIIVTSSLGPLIYS